MKTRQIDVYFMDTEFDGNTIEYKGKMKPVKRFIKIDVPINATNEEIEEIAKRKDVILINN